MLKSRKETSDVRLVAAGGEGTNGRLVHKALLAAFSPAFRDMFRLSRTS